MNKTNRPILAVAVIILLGLLVLFKFGSKAPKTTDKVAGKQQQSAPTATSASAVIESQQSNDDVPLNSTSSDNQTQQTTAQESAEPDPFAKLDYDDDWCTYRQLTEVDRAFADAEIWEWEQSVGRFIFGSKTDAGYMANRDDHISQPYLNLDKAELRRFVQEGDTAAMFAVLDRQDFSMEESYDVAKKLLVHGYTGKPIIVLVIHDMVLAKANYKENKLSEKTLKHLHNAMVFATYSLHMHDAVGFEQLVDMLEGFPVFQVELNPAIVFSKQDFESIAAEAEELRSSIELQREAKGLPPIDRELTKIAKHLLDRDIGTLYGLQPLTMQLLAEKYGEVIPDLNSNDCKKQYAAMFLR